MANLVSRGILERAGLFRATLSGARGAWRSIAQVAFFGPTITASVAGVSIVAQGRIDPGLPGDPANYLQAGVTDLVVKPVSADGSEAAVMQLGVTSLALSPVSADLGSTGTSAVWVTTPLGITPVPLDMRLAGTGTFPSLVPTARQFTPAKHPLTLFRAQNGASARRLWANLAGGATMDLGFRALADADAQSLFLAYDNARGAGGAVTVPASIYEGLTGSLLAQYQLTGTGLTWAFAGPPVAKSVAEGLTDVEVKLRARRLIPSSVGATPGEILPVTELTDGGVYGDCDTSAATPDPAPIDPDNPPTPLPQMWASRLSNVNATFNRPWSTIVADSDMKTYHAGLVRLTGESNHRLFIVKRDRNGAVEWQRCSAASSFWRTTSTLYGIEDRPVQVQCTADGSRAFVAAQTTTSTIWAACFDSSGSVLWQKTYDTVTNDLQNDKLGSMSYNSVLDLLYIHAALDRYALRAINAATGAGVRLATKTNDGFDEYASVRVLANGSIIAVRRTSVGLMSGDLTTLTANATYNNAQALGNAAPLAAGGFALFSTGQVCYVNASLAPTSTRTLVRPDSDAGVGEVTDYGSGAISAVGYGGNTPRVALLDASGLNVTISSVESITSASTTIQQTAQKHVDVGLDYAVDVNLQVGGSMLAAVGWKLTQPSSSVTLDIGFGATPIMTVQTTNPAGAVNTSATTWTRSTPSWGHSTSSLTSADAAVSFSDASGTLTWNHYYIG